MLKTVLELLEEQIQSDGYYLDDFSLTETDVLEELDLDELILSEDNIKSMSAEDVFEFFESEEAEDIGDDPDAFIKAFYGIDSSYYINSIGTLLFALQNQYETVGGFKRITLRELGEYVAGSFRHILAAYDKLTHSGHFNKKFLLELGRVLITESLHEYEFIVGLYLLSNFDYEEVLEVIPNMDDVLRIAQHYDWWKSEMVSALYLWEKDTLLFEIFRKSVEEGNNFLRIIFYQIYHPLRDEVGLYLANNIDIIEEPIHYSRYVAADKFLKEHYSENLLIGALWFVNANYRIDLLEEEEENKNKLDKVLVETLLSKDVSLKLYNDIYGYYLILKNENNILNKELEILFKNNKELYDFVDMKINNGQEDWKEFGQYLKQFK